MRSLPSPTTWLIFCCIGFSTVACETARGQTFSLNSQEFESKEEFIRQGRRCATTTLSIAQRQNMLARNLLFKAANANALQQLSPQGTPITIGVLFHVIHDGDAGKIMQSQLDKQIEVLKAAYAMHGVKFVNSGVDYTDNADWFTMDLGTDAEREAKAALAKNSGRMLNFYTCSPPNGTLGWATWPWDLTGEPKQDGVVVLHSAVPDGDAAPFNLGDTAVHEAGHWLGLFHTFGENPFDPCIDTDQVNDTPAHRVNFGTPPDNTDTCPDESGNDPVRNFMNYVDDAHMDRFTDEQIVRMHEHLALFRPLLLPSNVRTQLRYNGYK